MAVEDVEDVEDLAESRPIEVYSSECVTGALRAQKVLKSERGD